MEQAQVERRGPDFLVIGAMKAATSTINAYFETHPHVFFPSRTELKFFSDDEIWGRGHDAYLDNFSAAASGQMIGEGTNEYANLARCPETVERMAALYPNMRIIYSLRHPIERMQSAWVQNRIDMGATIPDTPDEAVRRMPELYVDQSLYWRHISAYLGHFPRENVHVCVMDDLKRDPKEFFAALCTFLKLPPMSPEEGRVHVNKTSDKRLQNRWHSRLSSVPGLRRTVRQLLPDAVRKPLREKYLHSAVDAVPQLSSSILDDLREVVLPDTRSTIRWLGRNDLDWEF